MSRRRELHYRMLAAPDALETLPPHFHEARAILVEAVTQVERSGFHPDSLVAALLAEALPRMVHRNGPAWTAAMLTRLARDLGAEEAAN